MSNKSKCLSDTNATDFGPSFVESLLAKIVNFNGLESEERKGILLVLVRVFLFSP